MVQRSGGGGRKLLLVLRAERWAVSAVLDEEECLVWVM